VKSQQAFEELSMTEKAQEIAQNKSDTREILVDEKNQTMNMLSDGNRAQRRHLDNTSMTSQKAEPMRRRQSKTLVELEEDFPEAEEVINSIRRVTNIDATLDWLTPKNRKNTRAKKSQQNTGNMSTMNKRAVHPKSENQQNEHTQSTQDLRSMLEQEINEMLEVMEAKAKEAEAKEAEAKEAEAKEAKVKEADASKKQYKESQHVSSTLEILNEDNMVTHDDVIKSMLQDNDDMASCGTLSTDNSSVCNSKFSIPSSDAELSALIQQKLDDEYSILVEYAGNYYAMGDMYEYDGCELY
jgi:hypothetical protein